MALVASWLQMNIAGALIEGVLQQPVDDGDDMGIISLMLLAVCAQLEQLFKIGRCRRGDWLAAGAVDRAGEVEECLAELADLHRAGQHAFDRASQHLGQIGFPGPDIGLGTGHGNAKVIHSNRQNAVTPGKGRGHQASGCVEVELQRVDVQIGQSGLLGQPLAQGFQIQALAGLAWVRQGLAGDVFERVDVAGQVLRSQ
ncbi:hypothetical protein D3C79_730070 [compost metagenome]